jgi:hypothetical protein
MIITHNMKQGGAQVLSLSSPLKDFGCFYKSLIKY